MTSNDTGHDERSPAAEPIAIIGMACRLPGARDSAQFWGNLADGIESIRFTSLEEQAERGLPESVLEDPNFVPAVSILDDYEYFDAAFFGMSVREAELRDPQHRLLLELSYTALEDSGYDPSRYSGDIGVYAGSGENGWEWHNTRRNPKIFGAAGVLATAVSSHSDFLSTLVSYKLDLRGPSFAVNTACSTSLVAMHLACEALRNGECDMALAGGVSIDLPPGRGYVHVEDGIYSRDGHVRAFDAKATGMLWGNGGGVVVLKRLSEALADGDSIRALVIGNAINNDGATKVGFTAPSQEGQAAVVMQALGVADIDPRSITYLEAHGTATPLGDPIEVAALSSAYQRHNADTNWCAIGTVKTNVGHLGHAAGITGVIKTALSLEHALIPPVLHFESPNPKIDFAASPFYVNTALSGWIPTATPRRAGVSSFGMGGTNAHLIMEEAPQVDRPRPDPRPVHLVQVSARTDTALAAAAHRLSVHLSSDQDPAGPALDLADVAFTLRTGRKEFARRVAVVAGGPADAAEALADPRRRITTSTPGRTPRVALMFSGQGAQFAGMGALLYQTEPVFRDVVDECCDLLRGDLDLDLRELMFAVDDEAAEERLQETWLTQPALFTIEYALARLWQAWGVQPAAMAGHSIGEYVAATLAGVFELPAALTVVAARGRLMQAMAPGSMLAVQLDEAEVIARLPEGVTIATVNGPGACVVSGEAGPIKEFATALKADRIGSRALRTSHAFHSPMMEPMLAQFREVVAAAELNAPRLPFLSNVTGTWITPAEATDPAYWARHLREPVRFGDCLTTLLSEGDWLLVECGPGRQLCGLARQQQRTDTVAALPSLPHRGDKTSDLEVLYTAAGRLWASGIDLDPQTFGAPGYRVPLPTYPWERKYCWIKPESGASDFYEAMSGRESGPRPLEQWFAVPTWRQLQPGRSTAALERCLLFADPAADPLADALRAAGAEVVRVRSGDMFALEDDGYTVRPDSREDYDALIADLIADQTASGGLPPRIVHAWTLEREPAGDADAAWQEQERGFFSLLYLVQALAAAQSDQSVQLDVLTAGTLDVTGADLTRPEHATVAGIVKVAPLEMPWLGVRQIDLDPALGLDDPRAAGEILGELRTEPELDATVAVRSGRRWQRHYETVVLPEDLGALPSGKGLREEGVYLITGGLGGIGITVAEDLAQRVRARLVLLTRSGLPPREEWDGFLAVHGVADRAGRAIAAVRRMEEAGAQVLVLAADVTSAAELTEVRKQTLERFGRVDGIVHSAGVPGGGMVEVKEHATAAQVMRPKVAGAMALREAFGDLDLDFVLLCSSVYAVSGEFGQVDYCAANNFLDAFARAGGDQAWKVPITSVNWGSWLEVGMSAEVAAPAAFRALQRGDRMTPMDHPILTRRYAGEDEQSGWCSAVVSPETHWVLQDHRIAGVPVLPGTTHLELVRAAVEAIVPAPSDRHAVELRDVAFIEPMSVPDGTSAELRVILTGGADGHDFQVVSLTAGLRRVHAQGIAGWVDPGEAPTADVAAIRERCTLALREKGEAAVSAGMLTFGPHWGNLRRIHEGQDEELALFEAGEAAVADLAGWGLHPALLDEATAYGRTSDDGRYLPLGYGRILIRGPIPARFWSHLRHRDTGTQEVNSADVTLLDEAGREVVSVTDFTLRHVDVDALAASMNSLQPAGAARSIAGTPAGSGETLTGGAASMGIRPADGAEAFRRLVCADLGAQVIVSVMPIDEIIASSRQFTQETIEGDLDASGGPLNTGADRTIVDGFVAPRTELEAAIARIWGDVLGGGQIGVDDDFFEIGGNSLIAVQLIALVRKELGVRLPMRSIFEASTVAAAAALIEQLRAADQTAGAAPAPAIQRLARRSESTGDKE